MSKMIEVLIGVIPARAAFDWSACRETAKSHNEVLQICKSWRMKEGTSLADLEINK